MLADRTNEVFALLRAIRCAPFQVMKTKAFTEGQGSTGPQDLNRQPAVRADLQFTAGSLLPMAIH